MLNHKGDINVIITMILILLSAAILLMIFPQLLGDSAGAVDRAKCKTQVDIHSAGKFDLKLPGELDQCKTSYIEVESKDEEEIKQLIADEMYYCWNQFGEGKKDFMSEWSGDGWCFICSRIDYDSRINKDVPVIENFDLYLRNQEFPYFSENKSVSFYEYIFGEANVGELETDLNIDTKKTTYILFFADKTGDFWDRAKGVGIAAGGTLLCAGGIYLAVQTAFVGTPAAVKSCIAGAGLAVSGTAYAIKHHPNFSAGLYIGDASGAVDACKGT